MNTGNDPVVAAVQMNSRAEVARNLDAAARLLEEARRQGAHVAVLPENFAFIGEREKDKLAIAEDDGAGPVQEFLAATARRLGLWIVAGSVPLKARAASHVRAACLVFDAAGERVARYDKIHLFDVDVAGASGAPERYRESATIEPGEVRSVVVESPAGRLGLSVCYDLRFPELYRELARQGADVLLVPSAFTEQTGAAHWDILVRARAVENQCYVVAPGQHGEHPGGRRTFGHSCIVDPWGVVLAQRGGGDGVITASVPRERLTQLRQAFPVLAHRRIAG